MRTLSFEEVHVIKDSEIEALKLDKQVYHESGTNPITISVVLPTFNNKSEEYAKATAGVIEGLGYLIDKGVVDELVIVDGSRDTDGNPDYDFIKFLLALGIKHCNTFSNEVSYVRSMPEGRQRSMGGRLDFSIRFMSQLDTLFHKIFLNHKLLTESEIEFLKKGKGAGLWYSIPVTYGDIVCFVDSDIKSFKPYYINALCKPILETWRTSPERVSDPEIVFTKAFYTRKQDTPDGGKLGGRLTRVAAAPIFRALNKMGVFKGLEQVNYPLSGECAMSIEPLKSIQFSNGYDIETSMLCQLWKEFSVDRMAQADLGIYQHISGSEEHVDEMLREILWSLKHWSKQYKLDIDLKKFIDEYSKDAYAMLQEYWYKVAKLEGITYDGNDMKQDSKRIERFKGIMTEHLEKAEVPKLLHPWNDIESKTNAEKGYSYQELKLSLRRRVNKFTSGIILSSIYIDKSDEIINKYVGVH